MSFIKEFRDFAIKGNVIDLAIAVIIGAAFNKIVGSLVEDVITPLLLKPALEALNLSKLEDLVAFGGVKYGVFISAVINFIIIALILFIFVRIINKQRNKDAEKPAAPPAPSSTDQLLMEIRDSLKQR